MPKNIAVWDPLIRVGHWTIVLAPHGRLFFGGRSPVSACVGDQDKSGRELRRRGGDGRAGSASAIRSATMLSPIAAQPVQMEEFLLRRSDAIVLGAWLRYAGLSA